MVIVEPVNFAEDPPEAPDCWVPLEHALTANATAPAIASTRLSLFRLNRAITFLCIVSLSFFELTHPGARRVRRRLVDAMRAQAFAALNASPGARAFYDDFRAHGIEHSDALRRLAKPSRRDPARMPEDPQPLRRGNRPGHRENLPHSSAAA